MPVGWEPSPEQRLNRQQPPINENTFAELLCVMGVFFALMALLPDFDGRGSGDWDKEEGDGERRR